MDEQFDYFTMQDRIGVIEISEHTLSDEQVCSKCESAPGYMLTDCPGTVLTAYEKGKVSRGRLDFRGGEWKATITVPRFIGTFDEVTAFLEAENAAL